jgi:hypothetical protein
MADLRFSGLLLPVSLVLLLVGSLFTCIEAVRSSGVLQCQEELSLNKPVRLFPNLENALISVSKVDEAFSLFF